MKNLTRIVGHERLLVGLAAAQRDVARRPVGWRLARIDLVAKVAVDDPLRPHSARKRRFRRVAARDAGDEPVTPREIEPRVAAERHDGRGGPRVANARDDRDDGRVGVRAHVVKPGGQRHDAIELFALDPKLQFPRRVAGVLARLEHRHDHDFRPDEVGGACARRE